MAEKKANDFSWIMFVSIALLAFFAGAVATPKTAGGKGFDDYGYNDDGDLFIGCLTNYYNWKYSRPTITCPENDLEVHAKWHFDKDGNLDWLINLLYAPATNTHVLKRFATINQDECEQAGGRWLNFQKVTQTGEIVPVCQLMEVTSGEGVNLIATPAGFGVYQGQ